MPHRPIRVTDLATETGAHVLNQNFREIIGQIDDLGKVVNRRIGGSPILVFPSIPAGQCKDATAYVTGANANLVAHANPTVEIGSNLIHSAKVLRQNQVSVRICNPTAAPITPSKVRWQIVVS